MKLVGQITRGQTAPNRLRKTDTFLGVAYAEFVRHMRGLYVDLGYGAYPVTSVETLRRLRRLNGDLRVLGVEIDPERVAEAAPLAEPGLDFRLGGFNLPLADGETVSVIRAFNVLRQYGEAEVADALSVMSRYLVEGGLIIEGTCDPTGRLLTFNLYRKLPLTSAPSPTPLRFGGHSLAGRGESKLTRIGFILAPTLRADFLPRQFQAVLPKNFIHHAEPGGAIDQFFAAWHAAWQRARAQAPEPRQVFTHAALRLADHYGYTVDRRPALLRRGFLWLGPEWPEKEK